VLFESLISQINMNEEKFEAHHGLADSIQCLRCGNNNAMVWNKTDGNCPKCGGKMNHKVTGSIRVKF
jgi:DNA-directed RNA polymerase subunit RPC12/RpoP